MSNEKYTPEELELLEYEGVDVNSLDNPQSNDITTDNPQNADLRDINTDLPAEGEDNPNNTSDNLDNLNNEPSTEKTTPLIAGKFKSYDDLIKAYSELERHLGTQTSTINELRKQVESKTSQPDNTTTVPDNNRITQEDMFGNVTDEQLQQFMLERPREFISLLTNQINNNTMNVVNRQNSVNKYVDEFFSENSDLASFTDEFKALSQELGNPQYALEIIRGRQAGNLDNLMNNTDYVQRNIKDGKFSSFLNDENISSQIGEKVKQKIINDYIESVKKSKSEVSPLNSNTGYASKVPPKTYENFNDMRDDSIAFLNELENERKMKG